MIYTDRLYGKFTIEEPVILDLIKSKSLVRLKGIDQAGYLKPYYPKITLTRFEHSLGVWLLLKKFDASREEQIAGLIHDVSHSAFSHCIDYVFKTEGQKTHEHQDKVFTGFVKKSDIPLILRKYRIDLNYILNEKNFPLKENKLPDLCADRLDYSLRSAFVFGEIGKSDLNYFLTHLTTTNRTWVFKDYRSAQKYADLFRMLNRRYYSGFPSALMFSTVGRYVRHALNRKYLSYHDLYTTDREVIRKINRFLSQDQKLRTLWERMNYRIKATDNPHDFDYRAYCKSRLVDPLCYSRGKLKRVSEINPAWKKIIQRESKPKAYFLKFAA